MISTSRFHGVKVMNRLVLEGEYLEIIEELLGDKYKVNSLIKLVFMSFCIKNEKSSSYRTRKMDFVDVFLDNINVKLLSHQEELETIFEVIYKLKTSGWIEVKDDEIIIKKEFEGFSCDNKFLKGCNGKQINPICEVNKLDNRAFTEEVLRHV